MRIKVFPSAQSILVDLVVETTSRAVPQASGLNYTIVRPGGLKNDDNPNPIVMSGADTLFDGSIPRQKVAQVCVESLTDPQALNKVLEVVSTPTAAAKSWADLFASV
jgi:hypothetical protein